MGPKPPVEDDIGEAGRGDAGFAPVADRYASKPVWPQAALKPSCTKTSQGGEEEEETHGDLRRRGACPTTTNRHQHHGTAVAGTCWICSTWAPSPRRSPGRLSKSGRRRCWSPTLLGDIFGGDPVAAAVAACLARRHLRRRTGWPRSAERTPSAGPPRCLGRQQPHRHGAGAVAQAPLVSAVAAVATIRRCRHRRGVLTLASSGRLPWTSRCPTHGPHPVR